MTTEPSATPAALPDDLPPHLGADRLPAPAGEVRLQANLLGFARSVNVLRRSGARFVTVFLARTPEPALVAILALQGDLVVVVAPTGDERPVRYGSLSADWPAARWAERELAEREDVEPIDLPVGRSLTAPDADLLGGTLEGLDVFQLPFGPVRSGVFEAIQFLIETGGENVPELTTRPFFKHRGLEQRCVGLTPGEAVYVAERIAGIATIAHATAFSHAVERALGVQAPPRAERWRAVHAELERIACHLDVIAKEAETTALSVGQARFQILKERVLRMRAALCGSRFGRGVVVPGGVRHGGHLGPAQALDELDELERDLARDRRLFLGTASMTDRLINAGHLERALLEDCGAVGPLARGSGISVDARHERPYGDYRRLGLRVITASGGDAMARINVRFGEITESLRILRQALDQLARNDGELAVALPRDSGAACGWAEAPQGEIVTWVEVVDGRIAHVHVASPSLRNWAVFDSAFPKDVLTDFAFIEHSFGLTPAGADR